MFRSQAISLAKNIAYSNNVRTMANIGFIGVGNMGAYMTRNLLKKGHKLSVYDVVEAPLKELKAENKDVTVCKNAQEVAEKSEVVVTMLPNNQIVLDTYLKEKGVLQGASKNTILVDSSTIAGKCAQEVHAAAKAKGIAFIDAPVSGGVVGARDATLTFMVGGEKETVKKVEEILLAMGKRVAHCGSVGMGQAAKICNNMLLAISMVGVSESMNLGIKLGLDPKVLMEIINSSTGRCWSSEVYNPVPNLVANVPPSDDYKGGFSTKLILKDLGLAQNAATDSHSTILLGSLAHQIYSTMASNGFSDKDFAAVYQFIK